VPDEKTKITQAKETAEVDKITVQDEANKKAAEAMVDVRKAEKELVEATTDSDKRIAEENVKVSKLKANIAFRNAKKSEPYPGIF